MIAGLRVVPFVLCAALFGPAVLASPPPSRVALVIGETAYAAAPALPACAGAAHSVTAALRREGFEVAEKLDMTHGEIDAALTRFARRLGEAPGSVAVVYFCGYAAALDARSFLLPVPAMIATPFDLLTQAVVTKALLDTMIESGASGGLFAIDAFAAPGNPMPLALDRLAQPDRLGSRIYVAVQESNATGARTPLAAAIADALGGGAVESGGLIGAVQRHLAEAPGAKLLVAQAAGSPAFGTAAPPRAAAVKPASSPEITSGGNSADSATRELAKGSTGEIPAATSATAADAAPSPPSPSPSSSPGFPAPERPIASAVPLPQSTAATPGPTKMTREDRRRIQEALAAFGYYSGRLDGNFGRTTRAAIRRFQHEIGAGTTGRLTPEQATRLLAGRS